MIAIITTTANPKWMASSVARIAAITGTAVDTPGPRHKVGALAPDPRNPEGKGHAHEERQRCDQRKRDDDLDRIRKSDQRGEQGRQAEKMQNGDTGDPGDRNFESAKPSSLVTGTQGSIETRR